MKSFKVLCKCVHQFQDKQNGKQVRFANPTSKYRPDDTLDVRCTVCNTIHTVKKD